jgi:predicted Fe-Mo cluster-binding NifX family protein
MVICVPVTPEGLVDGGFGRAPRVAVIRVEDGEVAATEVHDVRWDELHDAGPEGSHHARIARFLIDNGVEGVAAGHVGPPMQHTMAKMGIRVWLGAAGDARAVAIAAAAQAAQAGTPEPGASA